MHFLELLEKGEDNIVNKGLLVNVLYEELICMSESTLEEGAAIVLYGERKLHVWEVDSYYFSLFDSAHYMG